MTLLAAFMLMCFAGLQLTVTQNVTDCTDINAGLVTTPTDPVTGEALQLVYYIQWKTRYSPLILFGTLSEPYFFPKQNTFFCEVSDSHH